jgi:hypothetical protein
MEQSQQYRQTKKPSKPIHTPMPQKAPINSQAKKDLSQHLTAVEKSLFDLRFRLMHYFAGREEIRSRFDGIESIFKSYSNDCRGEVDRRLKNPKT